jgi:hypothetical protein
MGGMRGMDSRASFSDVMRGHFLSAVIAGLDPAIHEEAQHVRL